MRIGNISPTAWKRYIAKQLHTVRPEVVFQPSAEENCSIVHISPDRVSVCAHASASGNTGDIGCFAAARALNDLAIRGAVPLTMSVQFLFPLEVEESAIKVQTRNLEKLCKKVGTQITCVRVEVNPAVAQIVVFVTVQGEAAEDELRRAKGALPGQDIVLCGYAGLEGMLRILNEREEELSRRFIPSFIQQMKALSGNILALEAIEAARSVNVTAMHQIGSGGIFAGLWELAEASGIGLEVDLSKMSVRQETIELCEYYNLNPYLLTSAGCILMTADDGDALIKVLEKAGARATKLGVASDKSARVITSGEEQRYLDRPAPDELARWWELNGKKEKC